MAKITIDGKTYDDSNLSDEVKQQVANIRVVDQRIEQLERDLTITKTARKVYVQQLQSAMPQDA
ncbi:hypothetical protein C6W92_15950 [Roseovarius sp. A46]|uniref:DUF6447 family protein n=1 Tax=Roseovarius sp. A46 TaxID=2109331 RepID=UPI0010137BD5|nr:DUF6447 family protein [Roseovarius sp. A46]RXV59040.1 hypothetical protein C6W92_15950 [Roseovarius sp. A46]